MNEPSEIPGVLACDIGNSAIKFAHVSGDEIGDVTSCRVGELTRLGRILTTLWEPLPAPKALVAASVNPAACKALEAAASHSLHTAILVIGRDLPLPIDTDLPHPETVGVDRLCAAVAAFDRLGQACVVADFGTAITIDCVNGQGVFIGGAILPGLAMSADCLHNQTAQLPRVDPAASARLPGKDTTEAIQIGLLAAARGALRECVEAFAEQLGHWPLVICTGGDADLIVGDLKHNDLVQTIVPDLALRGVAMAYYRTLVK